MLAISHLPQVAAKGDAHYFVYKDNSATKAVSRIRQLNEDERDGMLRQMCPEVMIVASVKQTSRLTSCWPVREYKGVISPVLQP